MIKSPRVDVYPRGKAGGTFYAVVFDGDVQSNPISLRTKDREAAEQWAAEKLDELRRIAKGEFIAPELGPLKFADAWPLYASLPDVQQKSLRTREHEELCFGMFKAWATGKGLTTLNQVSTALVKEYRRMLQAKPLRNGGEKVLASRSVNNYMQHAGVVISFLIEAELYDGADVFKAIRPLKVPKKESKARPWSELLAIVDAARKHGRDMALVFILAMHFGIRRAEILRARWEHIDWAAGTITFHKTKPRVKTYTVPLYPEAIEALLPYRKDEGYIVRPEASEWPADVRYRWDYRKAMENVFKKANKDKPEAECIEEFSTHEIRHTLITRLRELGWSLQDIAAFVDQSEISVTEMYGIEGPELRRKSMPTVSLKRARG